MDAAVLASTPPAAAGEEPRDAPMVRGILRSVGLRGSASTTPVWWTDSWSSPAATRAMCSARPGRTPTTPAGRRSRPTTCTSRSGPSPRSPPGRRAVRLSLTWRAAGTRSLCTRRLLLLDGSLSRLLRTQC
ncbi:hypothetical protein PVAP13_2KG557600 [Panicum virgatum]|uniref:Uncharacterized protein n=1 Tax=Panicum virgatum TaxID=38727 RepID=A0A8T0WU46_PANVG|nr:hypothetical protein PVAP13_2KG557600 [Panicum virgatum]